MMCHILSFLGLGCSTCCQSKFFAKKVKACFLSVIYLLDCFYELHHICCFLFSTPECFIHCTLARDVWHGHFVQDAPGSVRAGPQLLLPLSPPLSRTYPALPLSQLLPHLPSSAGPVPRPGQGWWSPTETDQRKVSLGGFVVLAPSHSLPP